MKISLMPLLFAFTILSISINAYSQDNTKAFDSLLTTQFTTNGPGGVALVAKQGKVIYSKTFGKANIELNVPMQMDAVFRLGSNTKQFTAVAIMKLATEGKLSLQDDITKYISDYPTHGKIITIENLLTHTSGVKNYTSINWTDEIKRKDLTPKQLVDHFKNEPLDFNPGESYWYSNSGYVLLGYIIEQVSGKPYGQYIDENFFKPLNMKNSFYDTPSKIINNRVAGYKFRNGEYENADFLSMTLPYSAGSLLSTAGDMLIWYEALMNNKVLPAEILKKAHTSYQLANGRFTGYGYGWGIGNVQGSPSIKHTGVVNGFVTYTAYLPDQKIFIAIFSNRENTPDLDIPASKIAAILINKPYQYKAVNLTAAQLEAYQGIYNSSFEGNKCISVQDGELFYYAKGGPKSRLIAFDKDKFYMDKTLNTLEFDRNNTGNINGFTLQSTNIPVKYNHAAGEVKSMSQIHMAPGLMQKYTGKYQFGANAIFYVEQEGDKIYGRMGQDKKELVPFEMNKFYAKDIDAVLVFNMDAGGKVTSLTKIQNSEMDAKKLD